MSARLTKAQREEFVDAVMLDVPYVDFEERTRLAVQKAAAAALPDAVHKLFRDEKMRHFINLETVSVPRQDRAPNRNGWMQVVVPTDAYGRANKQANEVAETIAPEWTAQVEQRTALRFRLATVAGTCATRKQLAEALPDFVKYMPPETQPATANLPALATSVTQDFKAAGFPK